MRVGRWSVRCLVAMGISCSFLLYGTAGLAASPPPASEPAPPHGIWVDVGPMPVPTEWPTTVRLRDGRVLLLGSGDSGDCCCIADVTVFDPVSGTWSTAARQPEKRCGQAVALLRSGEVLAAGGTGWDERTVSTPQRRSVLIYHPAQNRWTATSPMHFKRSAAMAARLPDGKVLVAGGYRFRGGRRSAEIYHPATRTWRMTAPMAAPHSALIKLRNGDLLTSADSTGTPRRCAAERYVVRRHTWRPAGGYRAVCSRYPSELFRLPSGHVMAITLRSVHVYDPATNHWRRSPRIPPSALPVSIPSLNVEPVHGRPLALVSDLNCHPARSKAAGYLWRPAQHRWVWWTPVPRVLWGAASAVLTDGSIMLMGGVAGQLPCMGGTHIPTSYAYRYYPDR